MNTRVLEAYISDLNNRLATTGYSLSNNSNYSLLSFKREPSKLRLLLWVFAGKIIDSDTQTPQSLNSYFGEVRATALEAYNREFSHGLAEMVVYPVLISNNRFSQEAIRAAQNHKNIKSHIHELSALAYISSDKITVWRRAQAFQYWQLAAYRMLGKKLDEILKPDELYRQMPPSRDYNKLNFWWNLVLQKSKSDSK